MGIIEGTRCSGLYEKVMIQDMGIIEGTRCSGLYDAFRYETRHVHYVLSVKIIACM